MCRGLGRLSKPVGRNRDRRNSSREHRFANWVVLFALLGCSGETVLAGQQEDGEGVEPDGGDGAEDGAGERHDTDDGGAEDGSGVDGPSDADGLDDGETSGWCGNGVLEDGEQCDDGTENSDSRPDACRLLCLTPACGDGVVDTGERCDDGNRSDGDGCPASCFPDDEPPVTLVGDPVVTDDSFDAGGPPRVAWNGTGWGVAWGNPWGNAHFAALDADGRLLGTAVALPLVAMVEDLTWHDGGYGIVMLSGRPYREGSVALLDDAGGILSGPSWPPSAGPGIGLAWAPSLDAWVVAYIEYTTADDGGSVVALAMDRRAGFLGEPVVVSPDPGQRRPIVLPTEARILLAWTSDAGIGYRGFAWPDTTGEPPVRRLTEWVVAWDGRLGGAAYGTRTVIAWGDGDQIRTVAVDGWSLDTMHEPAIVGESNFIDVEPVVAAVPERGYLAVCYCTGPGYTHGDGSRRDRVMLRVIRPDGLPMGLEVTVQDSMLNAAGCSVDWSGDEFIVAYWVAGDSDPAVNTVQAQRVRPMI